MKAKIRELSYGAHGERFLTLTVAGRCEEQVEKLEGRELELELKERRNRRSLNANAYCWHLIGEIADELRASKEEVYWNMLRRYGRSVMVSVVEAAAQDFVRTVKYCDEFGESRLNGKLFKHYIVYRGSSEYDTKEMAVLIDGIVSEAKELGIETMTPDELEKLKVRWSDGPGGAAI